MNAWIQNLRGESQYFYLYMYVCLFAGGLHISKVCGQCTSTPNGYNYANAVGDCFLADIKALMS